MMVLSPDGRYAFDINGIRQLFMQLFAAKDRKQMLSALQKNDNGDLFTYLFQGEHRNRLMKLVNEEK